MTRPLTERLGLPQDRGPRVLVASAHPDDAEIGAGGSISRLAIERPDADVLWVVLAAPDSDRAAEARTSAERLLAGVDRSSIEIGGLRDGYLPYLGPAAKEALAAHQGFDPDLVFCPRQDDAHQDHRHLAELVPQVFRRALALEYEIPKWDGDLGRTNLYVPLTEAEATAKVEHVLAVFRTQHGRTWLTEDTLRAVLRLRGVECRAPDGRAEAFVCRKLVV
jgi:LmbE family N-acetylglucosaminyl deacetylase